MPFFFGMYAFHFFFGMHSCIPPTFLVCNVCRLCLAVGRLDCAKYLDVLSPFLAHVHHRHLCHHMHGIIKGRVEEERKKPLRILVGTMYPSWTFTKQPHNLNRILRNNNLWISSWRPSNHSRFQLFGIFRKFPKLFPYGRGCRIRSSQNCRHCLDWGGGGLTPAWIFLKDLSTCTERT